VAVVGQVEKIAALSASQAWDGLQVVSDLPGRGRGVKVTRAFVQNEVVCDYNGKLLTNKEGKEKYKNSQEQAMGYMFTIHSRGTPALLSTAHLIFFLLVFLSLGFVAAVYAK